MFELYRISSVGYAIIKRTTLPDMPPIEEVELVYTGDTMLPPLVTSDVLRSAKIIITECTYIEGDRERALIYQHVHVQVCNIQ